MKFHLRAVLTNSAGIICNKISEMKERTMSLDALLQELKFEFGLWIYSESLIANYITTFTTCFELTVDTQQRIRPDNRILMIIQLENCSQKKTWKNGECGEILTKGNSMKICHSKLNEKPFNLSQKSWRRKSRKSRLKEVKILFIPIF